MIKETENILESIVNLRNNRNILDKKYISKTYSAIGSKVESSVYFNNEKSNILLGDDAAAIPQENGGYLLFAAEGIIKEFLDKDPWFAGYSAIMVNISDICAMGGLPVAVTDTLYAYNADDGIKIWEGMVAASQAYGVPIIGGHTCYHQKHKALSVSILGKATHHILTSFNAKTGEAVLMAIDLNGSYYKDYPFWNASTTNTYNNLQKIAQLPYQIANNKWSSVAKDISMGGIIGTLIMLLNSSNKGAEINLEDITKPKDIPWEKWLSSFPSYGYLFTCAVDCVPNIKALFLAHNINCDHIGHITTAEEIVINYKEQKIKF